LWASISVGVGSLLNQLLYYLIMQMKEFSGYATLSDSANQFHILSIALLIIAFSIDNSFSFSEDSFDCKYKYTLI